MITTRFKGNTGGSVLLFQKISIPPTEGFLVSPPHSTQKEIPIKYHTFLLKIVLF